MTLDQKIYQHVRNLPRPMQEDLLDYVEFLVMKAEQHEQKDWESLSLSSAMRDMQDEPISYRISDMREKFD